MSDIVKYKAQDFEKLIPEAEKINFPAHKFIKEAQFAAMILNNPKNSYLAKASRESVLRSVFQIAQVGLTLNPVAKEAFLVPRWSKDANGVECTLEPSYIGLTKLLTDSGSVKAIQVNLIYQGDDFDVNLGLETEIKHKPFYVTGRERGDIKGVYGIAILPDGNKQYEHMTIQDVFKIREKSESWIAFMDKKTKTCIWNDSEGEMVRKTLIKRMCKYLPRTQQTGHLDNAIQLANQDYEASTGQIGMIESLLSTASILESQKEEIERGLPTMNSHDAGLIIGFLQDHQPDKITSGAGYSQADINSRLDFVDKNERL